MIENLWGTAMALDDGNLSIIVRRHRKDSLADYLLVRGIPFSGPTPLRHVELPALWKNEYELIVSRATERDFQMWTNELLLILK